jgi:hypothetical protein
MAQVVLPNQINYQEQLPSLKAGVNNLTQVLNPSNGSKFSVDGSQIIIDFPSRGFIDPKSIYFSYNMSVTKTTEDGNVVRCPLYAPFSRLDLYINNVNVESVTDYNLIACLWTELYMGPNEKASVQTAFGYSNTDGAITKYDSRLLAFSATASTYKVSGPLICSMLSSMDKFFPAFASGAIRLIFTLDNLNNYITHTTTRPTAFEVSNFQVTYDLIDFGAEIEQSILSMPQVVIKSSGFINSNVNVPVGTAGNTSFIFNTRLASIRNAVLYASCASSATTFINGKFDHPNLAGGDNSSTSSTFALNIGGVSYPQAGPLSTGNSGAILMELRKATGNLYDWSKSMSINNVEFSYTETGKNLNTGGAGVITTALEPAKFLVGFDLNKINSSSSNMLNGTSSQNSPIVAQISFAAATTLAKSLNLTCNYDAILTLDTRTKQLTILQ